MTFDVSIREKSLSGVAGFVFEGVIKGNGVYGVTLKQRYVGCKRGEFSRSSVNKHYKVGLSTTTGDHTVAVVLCLAPRYGITVRMCALFTTFVLISNFET